MAMVLEEILQHLPIFLLSTQWLPQQQAQGTHIRNRNLEQQSSSNFEILCRIPSERHTTSSGAVEPPQFLFISLILIFLPTVLPSETRHPNSCLLSQLPWAGSSASGAQSQLSVQVLAAMDRGKVNPRSRIRETDLWGPFNLQSFFVVVSNETYKCRHTDMKMHRNAMKESGRIFLKLITGSWQFVL